MRDEIDTLLSIDHVIAAAQSFLEECEWQIELDGKMMSIPSDTTLAVKSRAFIAADINGVILLDDHLQAVVLVGIDLSGSKPMAEYFQLMMYFNMDGKFVTEDRYSPQGKCL